MIDDLSLALKSANRSLADFERALDMGSGAGCVERWLVRMYPQLRISASDIHAPSIKWLGRHFPSVDANLNQPEPPLKYAARTFDLIWAFSVFTHLPETRQFSWLNELHRIARPRAIVVLTTIGVHGAAFYNRRKVMEPRFVIDPDSLDRHGFIFIPRSRDSTYGVAYHSPSYVRRTWSEHFRELAYVSGQVDDVQDIWVLEAK
jgi:hypothetical protein